MSVHRTAAVLHRAGLRLVALAVGLVLTGCASSHNPTFDSGENKPVIPGQSVGPGQGAGDVGLVGRGPGTSTCVGGWVAPAPGTALYARGLAGAGLPSGTGVTGVRYFAGPDPAGHEPYDALVSRWVVTLDGRQASRGRLLVEARASGTHIVAVAATGTHGWAGGGWRLTAEAGVGIAGADAVAAQILPAYQAGCVG